MCFIIKSHVSPFLSRTTKIKITDVQLKPLRNIAMFIKFLVVLLQVGELINWETPEACLVLSTEILFM